MSARWLNLLIILSIAGTAQALDLRFTPVVTGLNQPVYLTHAGDGSHRLFVVQQTGEVRLVRDGVLRPTPFLDLSSRVLVGDEQGLLGLAFAPDFASSRRLYVYFIDRGGDSVLARLRVGSDPDQVDAASIEYLLQFDQPFANHNGGWIGFGPDGFLYLASGDGGSQGATGQDRSTLLGKMLRLDVSGGTAVAAPGNPFANVAGARPEIWSYGLRNPWRASFDRQTGDLWIADVGQSRFEEVNFQPAASRGGENYGWRVMEGGQCGPGNAGCSSQGFVLPVSEYGHDLGCSITGGYVYRGADYPGMVGRYLYGDFCTGLIWSLRPVAGSAPPRFEVVQEVDAPYAISSFGEGEDGNLYLVDISGAVYLISDGPPLAPSSIDASYTGTWYDPAQAGHGLFVEVLNGGQLLAWWFTFGPDGQQSWFGGAGTIAGNRATIQVVRTLGGRFIPNFDPALIQNQPFGTLELSFADCASGRVDFDLPQGYGRGSMQLRRLTVVAGVTCAP